MGILLCGESCWLPPLECFGFLKGRSGFKQERGKRKEE